MPWTMVPFGVDAVELEDLVSDGLLMLLKSARELTADVVIEGADGTFVSTRNDAGMVNDGLLKVALAVRELSSDLVDDDVSSRIRC